MEVGQYPVKTWGDCEKATLLVIGTGFEHLVNVPEPLPASSQHIVYPGLLYRSGRGIYFWPAGRGSDLRSRLVGLKVKEGMFCLRDGRRKEGTLRSYINVEGKLWGEAYRDKPLMPES